MNKLGRRLKEAREKTHLTQQQVADRLGISNGTLSGYERNYRDPDTDTLSKLAELYGVSVDWLTGRTDKENEVVKESSELSEYRKKAIEEIWKMSEEEVNYFYELMKRIKK